jgi:hypothetical protein
MAEKENGNENRHEETRKTLDGIFVEKHEDVPVLPPFFAPVCCTIHMVRPPFRLYSYFLWPFKT